MKRNINSLFILALLLFLFPTIIAADCPHGEINDAYPGECGLYLDQNKDGICDSSQTTQELAQATQPQKIESGLINSQYNFLIIAIILVVVYLLSSFLSRAGKIYSPLIHKRIWNLLLLISFLGVGISGLLFVLRVEFGINLSWFPKMLFWHVEAGIIMAIISIFHVLWHLSYFKLYFKKAGQ